MANESRGWRAAGIGFGLESAYGTAVAADTWLKVENESLKENKVPRRRRSIIPVTTAAARCAYPASGRYHGVNIGGGQVTIEAVYEGLDKLFYIFFGSPSQAEDSGAFTKTFPNAEDPPTKPAVTMYMDRSISGEAYDLDMRLVGAQLTQMTFNIVPEEAAQFVFDVMSTDSDDEQAQTPSFPSEEYVMSDWHFKLEIDPDGLGYDEIEFDNFTTTYNKNVRIVPRRNASAEGLRLPIRQGYPTATIQVVRLYQNKTYYDCYRDLETVDVRLTADGQVLAGTGSTNYGFVLTCPACTIVDTGPTTTDEGVRVETLDIEVDTNGTDTPYEIKTTNEYDGSSDLT